MAIFRPIRKNSGVETLLKVLHVLTADITLVRGEILLSQFKMINADTATKMSLFLEADHNTFIGVRNVWLQDVADTVVVTFANEQEGVQFVEDYMVSNGSKEFGPDSNREVYRLDSLDRAAEDIRNFLLLGVIPSTPLTPENAALANLFLKTIEFDVIASLDPDFINHKFNY